MLSFSLSPKLDLFSFFICQKGKLMNWPKPTNLPIEKTLYAELDLNGYSFSIKLTLGERANLHKANLPKSQPEHKITKKL
jgi:hypothetical protein